MIGQRLFVAASTAATFLTLTTSAAAQCTTGGAGGSYPAPGAVTGTWDSVLPTGQLTTTLAVTAPPGATVVNSVILRGLNHTWGGDTHVVLEAPSGTLYNLMVLSDSTSPGGGGCSDIVSGDFTIVDPGLVSCGGGGPSTFSCGTGTIAGGTYAQEFSTWTSGNAGLNNTPLESIPAASGNWSLHLYDWYPPADGGTLTSWEICMGSPTPPPTPGGWNCVSGGAGGAFPAPGAVEGTWSTVLPTGELISPLAVTVPAGATKIKSVKLNGLSHTWSGDCQIVLQDPSGTKHNLFQNQDGVFGGGCSDAFGGNYAFVDVALGTNECGGPASTFACAFTGSVAPDAYHQLFGIWPNGDSGIFNTPLESIPLANGTWNVIIYDWYVGFDNGTLGDWELCFDAVSGPTTYCPPTAPGSSSGCLADISATGNPNVSHSNSCVITVSNVEGAKSGLIFYGINGTNNAPWCAGGNSFLCVKAPTQRTPTQSTGGVASTCGGQLVLDWNSYQTTHPGALGAPWSVGDQAQVQGWFRDPPACKTTFLSEAMILTYQP